MEDQKPNLTKAIFALLKQIIKKIWNRIGAKNRYRNWRAGVEIRDASRIQRASMLHDIDKLCKNTSNKTNNVGPCP